MPTISLTPFIDFMTASTTARVTKVKDSMAGDDYLPSKDFWKRLRDAIVAVHRDGAPLSRLGTVLDSVTEKNRERLYPEAIETYSAFLAKRTSIWFAPPTGEWRHDRLTVRINPELGLIMGDAPYVVKLYFREKPLTKRSADLVFELLRTQFPSGGSRLIPAVIDVRHGKLIAPTVAVRNVDVLLRSEAAAFLSIWDELRRRK